MRITHEFKIELDIATVPVPDMEDAATLAKLKKTALDLAEQQIDAKHEVMKAHAREARERREGKR